MLLRQYRSVPTVIRRRRVPTPDAAPVWPATLLCIGTRRLLYEETTVGLGGEGDVTFCWFVAAFVIIRHFCMNRVRLL